MKKKAARNAKTVGSKASSKGSVESPVEPAFDEIVELIRLARQQAARAVNTELIELYWRIGDYLHHKDDPKLSPLLRELPWSSQLHILSRTNRPEEREFYLRMATQNRWPVREVARQLDAALFERAVLNPPKLSTALRELHPAAAGHFKDAYLLEFLGLPAEHSEADLHGALVRNLQGVEEGIQEMKATEAKLLDFLQTSRYFYKSQPLRTLEKISADILAIEKEAEGLLGGLLGGHVS